VEKDPPPLIQAFTIGGVSTSGLGASSRSLGDTRGLAEHDWIVGEW
jgi:hypothetical protein